MTNRLDLDRYEVEVLRSFERGELSSIRNFEQEKRRMEAAAREFFKKDQRINIRISSRDLENLQKKAAAEGMPYQTLISSTLHKFVIGKLKPVN
ncbi:MAG: CopG family antitoxin [Gammaproteobacteria bacterium]|nr:CopG family antitoxin [Gammaproteobacteria bacterium]